MTDLDDRLLAAHAIDDRERLVTLYTEAADQADDLDATAFYLTHAFVFALDVGSPKATALHKRLRKLGRV